MEELVPALGRLALEPRTALAERVAPLLYFRDPENAPSLLRKAYYESAARSVTLFDALDELRAKLGSRGIRPVLLKGADLASSLYPTPALRPMSDLDLWVQPGEVILAEEVLASLGYRPAMPEMTPGLACSIRHARLYVGGARGEIGVDLHWSLVGHATDRRSPSLEWFRSRCRESRLEATAHLLYLAAHMKLQHYDERVPLIWLVDFFLLSRRPEIDFDELSRAARTFGWEMALAATCEEVERRLRVGLPGPLTGNAPQPCASPPREKGGPERAWNELKTLSLRGRAALIRAYLLPSPAYLRFKYRPRPEWTWPLYYPFRWARLLASALSLLTRSRRSRPLLSDSPAR